MQDFVLQQGNGKEFAFGDYSDFGLELEFYNCFKKTIKYIKFELSRRDEFTEPQEEIPEDDYRSFNRRSNSLTNKKGE